MVGNMAKILLVEDDQSLREIYSIRLTAEGYEIVTAGDGEEALAMAVKERPDLVLSDVMMPKISGFDMLDILRSTPETKDMRVIMMTALSSDDQRQRGENLGADRYLVKSQVGIEDVVNAVHDVMGDLSSPVPVDTPAEEPTPAVPQFNPNVTATSVPQAPVTPQPVVPQPSMSPQSTTSQDMTIPHTPVVQPATLPQEPVVTASPVETMPVQEGVTPTPVTPAAPVVTPTAPQV